MNVEKPSFIEITVDRARPEELPKIIGIYRHHNGVCNDVGCHNTFVARDPSGVAVGAVTIERIQPGWVSLRTVGVEPELQGRGIGEQLISEVVEKLRREGAGSITVDLNLTQNQQGFYEKLGFKPLDSRSMVYRPGD
jgi:ribosomal protein S18 acetylase RimI-like enzyme